MVPKLDGPVSRAGEEGARMVIVVLDGVHVHVVALVPAAPAPSVDTIQSLSSGQGVAERSVLLIVRTAAA